MPISPTDEAESFDFSPHEQESSDSHERHTYCINILPNDATHRHSSAATSSSDTTDDAKQISDEPVPIHAIDPMLSFVSRSPIAANSNFTILEDEVVVFWEMTGLTLSDTPPIEAAPSTDGLLYTTSLVPGYWKTISESSGRLRIPSASFLFNMFIYRSHKIHHIPGHSGKPPRFWNSVFGKVQIQLPC